MASALSTYKEKYHFSVNFYSIFLLFTFIPDIIHANNLVFKYSFWGVKLVLACWVISGLKSSGTHIFSALEKLFFLVFLIYAANIYVDVFVHPLPALEKTNGTMDFIGFCINMLLALSFRYDPALHSEKSFRFFWSTLSVGLIIAYFMATENIQLDVNNIRYDANSTVNTINYGQMGCALAIVSIVGILSYNKSTYKFLFLLSFLIGIISIAKAGSRSPIIVLALVTMFYFIARSGMFKAMIVLFILTGLFFIFFDQIIELLNAMGSSIAVRLQNTVASNDTSGRTDIWSNTLDVIKKDPVFGKYYIIPTGVGAGGYPHNFFLEAFMATGLLGGIPFISLIIIGLFKSYKIIRHHHPAGWIALLYLQMVIYGCFSSSLYSSQDLWTALFFICSFNISDEHTAYILSPKNEPQEVSAF